MKLITPDGRKISVNPGVYPMLKKQGYKDPDELKSTDFTVEEAKNMTLSMNPEEIEEFIEGDKRKTVQSWAGQAGTEND